MVVVVEESLEQKTTELTRTMKMGTRVNSESIREVSLTHSHHRWMLDRGLSSTSSTAEECQKTHGQTRK